jgi:hypothetical protein
MARKTLVSDSLLLDTVEFQDYKNSIPLELAGGEITHIGEPEDYPCYVKTFRDVQVEVTQSYYLGERVRVIKNEAIHLFFYPSEAERLVLADELFTERMEEEDEHDIESRLEEIFNPKPSTSVGVAKVIAQVKTPEELREVKKNMGLIRED